MQFTNCGDGISDSQENCDDCGDKEKNLETSYDSDIVTDANQPKNIFAYSCSSDPITIARQNSDLNSESLTVTEPISVGIKGKNRSKVMTKYNTPLDTSSFFITQILFLIPVVNLSLMLFWAFNKNVNKNRQAYARSKLIWVAILSLVLIFIILTMAFMQLSISFNSFLRILKDYFNSLNL